MSDRLSRPTNKVDEKGRAVFLNEKGRTFVVGDKGRKVHVKKVFEKVPEKQTKTRKAQQPKSQKAQQTSPPRMERTFVNKILGRKGKPTLLYDNNFNERREYLEALAKKVGTKDTRETGFMGDSVILWEDIKTYQELMMVTTFFLRGMLAGAPYFDGQIYQNSKNLVGNKLIAINAGGFVSVDGQPQSYVTGVSKVNSRYVYEIDQISYLIGFLPLHHQDGLRKFAQKKRSLGVHIIAWTYAPKKLFNTFPKTDAYMVTRDRQALTRNALAETEWEPFSHLRPGGERIVEYVRSYFELFDDTNRTVGNILKKECMFVELAGPKFGKNGIAMEDVILEYLKTPEAMKLTEKYRIKM